jgi:hypothetical protein
LSRDAHHCGDKRSPFTVVERRSRGIDFDTPVFLAISCKITAVIDLDRRRRCGDTFKAT